MVGLATLQYQRAKLMVARDEMDRTIKAIDTVMAFLGAKPDIKHLSVHGKRMGRPPGTKNATKMGARRKKRDLTPEGEARRLAGYRAWQERRAAKKDKR